MPLKTVQLNLTYAEMGFIRKGLRVLNDEYENMKYTPCEYDARYFEKCQRELSLLILKIKSMSRR
jgi:hypothetical protein